MHVHIVTLRMSVHVCTYVCTYVRAYIAMYARMYFVTHVSTHVSMRMCRCNKHVQANKRTSKRSEHGHRRHHILHVNDAFMNARTHIQEWVKTQLNKTDKQIHLCMRVHTFHAFTAVWRICIKLRTDIYIYLCVCACVETERDRYIDI